MVLIIIITTITITILFLCVKEILNYKLQNFQKENLTETLVFYEDHDGDDDCDIENYALCCAK